MDTKFEPHRQRRGAKPYADEHIDDQDESAKYEMKTPGDETLDRLRGETETIRDDEHVGDIMEIDSETPLLALPDAFKRTSSQKSVSLSEDNTGSLSYDGRENRLSSAHSLPQANHGRQTPIYRRGSSRITRTPSRTRNLPSRGAKTFMSLYDAIVRLLAALSKQERSPFRTSLPKQPDTVSHRGSSPGTYEDTVDFISQDVQPAPDQSSMSGIVLHTTSSDSPPTVADETGSRDEEWGWQKHRTHNMLIRLLQWKYEFDKGDLQILLSGTWVAGGAREQAVKPLLLSIGEKLSDLVEYWIDKPRMSEDFQKAVRRLNDYIQRGREALCYSQSRDDTSSITSETASGSSADSTHAVDQQLDEVDRDLDLLISMRFPTLLRGSLFQSRSKQRKNLVKRAPHLREKGKTKESDHWASAKRILCRTRLSWLDMRPSGNLELWFDVDKSLQLTMLISTEPTVFQPENVEGSIARHERDQSEPIESLTDRFSGLRTRPLDNKPRTDIIIIQVFRDKVAPKLHHEPNSWTDSLLESIDSIDFTVALLDSLPNWLLYTSLPHGKEFAKALGVSVQIKLLDEFWDSCVSLVDQLHGASPSRGHNGETQKAKQRRYVQSLLLHRVRRLQSLRINRSLVRVWDHMLAIMNDLVISLRDCTFVPKFEAETKKQPVYPSLNPALGERAEYSASWGSIRRERSNNNITPDIEVPNPVRIPPAHLLCYAVPATENGLGRSNKPLRRGPTGLAASTSSATEEMAESGISFCPIKFSAEFNNFNPWV
ncbi:hypothetical protein NPX13_g8100 [Xylaria arbuscula]|uniref:Uncharacterized protein n=1 Tax=Xylaria arbuscula TaxID=114810 RepID=A0A9W8N930_9PEZI|nr:hypothetical protein NPX13_g8100 [Xylaria arbuscula]